MDAKGRPSSAGTQTQELAELAKLAARRARPPSAGQKEGALPSSGKLDKLDRQDTDAQCRSNSAPSKRLGRSRSGLRQRQGLAGASSGKMGSCASLSRFNGFGSAKSGFVQKIRAAWGTGECNGTQEEAEKPSRSNSKTESKKSCARKPSNNWTVLSYLEDSWSLEMEGIWWEWQWWSPSGWSFFSSWVTEQIEKAFTMGKASCSLLHDGRPVEFDLHTGREVNGLGRIRRIRMPCDDTLGHGASVCSTFLATDRDGVSLSTMGENTMSLWTGVVGDSKVLREEPEASSGRTACQTSPQRVVHDTTVFGGFSSGWSADASATHKPGRHGSRLKHRSAGIAPAVACISLKDINHTPLTSSDHVHHVWREEAYAALNRAGKLADPTH